MNYIVMGLLFGLGFNLVRVILNLVYEVIRAWMVRTKWFVKVANAKPKRVANTMNVKSVKNQIGFEVGAN